MLKILSVKTRRADSTREAFRRHYEERHVPLGLARIEHFRWRKYVRNHVLDVETGSVDFDCLTEFWVAGRADQEATAAFVASPCFGPLDEDDRRFLDVDRRFSCELAESLEAGSREGADPRGTQRRAAIFARPAGLDPARFAARVASEALRLARMRRDPATRLTLDLRTSDGARPGAFAAIVSTWAPPGRPPESIAWQGESVPEAVVLLDVVETPPEKLFESGGRPGTSAGA